MDPASGQLLRNEERAPERPTALDAVGQQLGHGVEVEPHLAAPGRQIGERSDLGAQVDRQLLDVS